jgi:hypothetical protein
MSDEAAIRRKLIADIARLEVDLEELRYEVDADINSARLSAETALQKSNEVELKVKELEAELNTIIELLKPKPSRKKAIRRLPILGLIILGLITHQWPIIAACLLCLILQSPNPSKAPHIMGSGHP